MLKRIVVGLAALAFVIPAAEAQRTYRVGMLTIGSKNPSVIGSPLNTRFPERLAELGFRQGRNVELEWRFANGDFDRIAPLTAELAQAKVDVIVTIGNRIAQLVTEANPTVPMVSLSCDSFDFVKSYAKPTGNFTGVTCMSTELSPKRLEIAKQLVPKAKRAVFLHNPNQGDKGLALTQKAAPSLGIQVEPVEMRSSAELEKAFAAIVAKRPDVLVVYPDSLTAEHRKQIADFALAQRLPAVYAYREFAEAGGLVSYGSTLHELADRAAELVARILRGAKPSELPLQQATRVYLTINLKSARELGFAIPQAMLQRADFVIDSD